MTGITFNWEINLGHVLTLVGLAASVWVRFEKLSRTVDHLTEQVTRLATEVIVLMRKFEHKLETDAVHDGAVMVRLAVIEEQQRVEYRERHP